MRRSMQRAHGEKIGEETGEKEEGERRVHKLRARRMRVRMCVKNSTVYGNFIRARGVAADD